MAKFLQRRAGGNQKIAACIHEFDPPADPAEKRLAQMVLQHPDLMADRGLGDVQLIGSGTCGKPYGFTPKDNCGVSYFPIEFRGINAKGFGDYADGFAPTSGAPTDTNLPGCSASDDLDKPLGNTSERMLSAALTRAATGSCPASATATRQSVLPTGVLQRDAVRAVRVLGGGAGPR